MRAWVNETPNEGIIRFTTVSNQEWLYLTSSDVLHEVRVTRIKDWEKPLQMCKGFGRILGIEVLSTVSFTPK